jgi:hypothetical protein
MARSKQNKQKQQAAKNAAAKMKKSFGVKDIDDLMEQMDKEDAKQDADDSSVHGGGRKKIPKEDLSDDEEDTEEEDAIEEEYEKAVDAIMNANIEDSTKHGYRLNLVRLVKFLYSKKSKASSKKNKTNIASFSELLHDDLLSDMNAVVAKKGSEKEMKDVIQKHLLKANAEYHPIDDCGVCAYSFPTLYLRGLEKQGLLSTVEKDQNRQPAPYIQNVELQLPSTMNTFTFGATARRHMKRSLRHGVLDTKSPMFDCEVVWS